MNLCSWMHKKRFIKKKKKLMGCETPVKMLKKKKKAADTSIC